METISPFFSVIVPTYNRGHIIAQAIQSVISQTFTNWELIIIDDGSSDNTCNIIEEFTDVRVNYYYQKNTERSQARNNGIKLAKGNFICFLDSDDTYCVNHLEVFQQYIKQHNFPKALLFSNPIVIHNQNEIQEKVPPFSGNDSLAYILKNSIIPDRVCIHRNVFENYEFNPQIYIGEDTILWAQITNTYPMFHIDQFTVKYLIHDDNSVNLKNNVYRNRLDGLLQLFSQVEIKKRLYTKLKNEIVSVCYYGIARHYELKRNFVKMSLNAILSIVYDLKSPQNKAKLYMIYGYFKSK